MGWGPTDRFDRLRFLGEGGSSTVTLVLDRRRGDEQVALKELTTSTADREAALRHEFATLKSLRHPNLVEVYEFLPPAGGSAAAFTLEYVDGVDLVTYVRDGRKGLLLELVAETLRALAFLHDFGVVHRDLKPQNVLIRRHPRGESRVVLLDFGLALDGQHPHATQPAGTLPYIAPELLEGHSPSGRSDLYALGAMAYEAIFGRTLNNADVGSSLSVLSRLNENQAIAAVPDSHPPGLQSWLEQLTAVRPEERPATAAEALAILNSTCGTRFELETRTTRAARLASGRPPGRDAVTEQLLLSVRSKGDPRVILITGDAGQGKSRTVRWLFAEAVRAGKFVEVVSAVQDRSTEEVPGTEPSVEVFFVDDPESVGSMALEKIQRIAQGRLPNAKVVVSFRASEASSPELRRLLGVAEWDTSVARIDLTPLSLPSVELVLERVTGRNEHGTRHAVWLHEQSEGVPLILESLIIDEAWQLGRAAHQHPTIANSISRRLESLIPSTRQWLECLVALGSAHDATLEQVTGLSREATAQATGDLEFDGLAVRHANRWAPASGIVSRIVMQSLDASRRRDLYRKCVEVLQASQIEELSDGRLALLWAGAGDYEKSAEHARAQAQKSLALGRPSEGADWYRQCLLTLSRRDPRRAELRRRLADVLAQAGRYEEAVRAYGALLRYERGADARSECLSKQAYALVRGGRFHLAVTVAENAIALSTDPNITARARNARGTALISMSRYSEALPGFLESASQFERVGNDASHAQSLQLAGLCATNLRKFDEARRLLNSAVIVAERCANYDVMAGALITQGIVERRSWNFAQALDCYERARSVIQQHDLFARLPILLFSIGHLHLEREQYDVALATFEEAVANAQHSGDRGRLVIAKTARADVLIRIGRPNQAIEELAGFLTRFMASWEPKTVAFARFTMAEAMAETRYPDVARMREWLADAVSRAPDDARVALGGRIGELECRLIAGDPSFDDAWAEYEVAAAAHPAALEPPMEMRALLARAEALVRRERPGDALAVATRAAELGEAKDLPSLAARAHAQIAAAKRLAGDSAVAMRSLARAKELLDEAAGRIGDEEMRRGFLDRPVFRSIRRAGAGGATSGEQRLLAIYDMIRVLNSETDPEELLSSMLDMALDVVRAERGLILLGDGESSDFAVRLARNLEKETIDDATEFSRNVVMRAGAGKAVLAVDTGIDERLRDLKSVTAFGIRSVLCVPLRSRGRIVGTVYLDNRREGSLFTPDDLRFLEAFADHAALALENARIRRDLELENRRLRVAAHERVQFDNIIGRSEPMQQVFELIEKTAESRLPVLILGESGTGKELVARSIHAHSPRRQKPFLSENCAAIPESLLESELFGHVRGAFTGAERDRMGLFEQANGGTLFLDEIGDMPQAMQARLLRVLQEGELRRVGGEGTLRVDVRLVAATHRDLQAEVRAGRLREDLYYRLQVLVVRLPPLRVRFGDVPLLLAHFLERISRERGRPVPKLHGDVLDLLERYAWPGNVRQLENHIQRLALLAGDGAITLDVVRSDRDLRETLLARRSDPAGPVQPLEKEEQQLIREALSATKGNRERAARMLGISRSTMFRKIKAYGLDRS